MTTNISQHVIPRFSSHFSYSTSNWQRGSITHHTYVAMFALSLLILTSVMGFLYLQQIMQTAGSGGEVQALEQKVLELKEKQRTLELEGARLRSIQTVEQQVEQLNLVATDQVAYLSDTPDRVTAYLGQ